MKIYREIYEKVQRRNLSFSRLSIKVLVMQDFKHPVKDSKKFSVGPLHANTHRKLKQKYHK